MHSFPGSQKRPFTIKKSYPEKNHKPLEYHYLCRFHWSDVFKLMRSMLFLWGLHLNPIWSISLFLPFSASQMHTFKNPQIPGSYSPIQTLSTAAHQSSTARVMLQSNWELFILRIRSVIPLSKWFKFFNRTTEDKVNLTQSTEPYSCGNSNVKNRFWDVQNFIYHALGKYKLACRHLVGNLNATILIEDN